MAHSTFNTKLMVGTTEYAIKNFPEILAKRSSIDVTTLSDDAKKYIPGIRQTPDSFDFLANYDAAEYEALNGLTTEQDCKLIFGDGSGFTWKGGVSASISSGEVDNPLNMTISVVPSTVPVWAKVVA